MINLRNSPEKEGGMLRLGTPKESQGSYHEDDDGAHSQPTLDPTTKHHRILALIIDHTSKQGECDFYRSQDKLKQCVIAPRFKVMWGDCEGRCFVHGLTCSIILEYLEERCESPDIWKLSEVSNEAVTHS